VSEPCREQLSDKARGAVSAGVVVSWQDGLGEGEGYVCECEKRGDDRQAWLLHSSSFAGGGALGQTRRAVKAAAFAGVT
jgi:hypothetical protein